MNFKKQKSALKSIRAKKFPKCRNLIDLNLIFSLYENINNEFGLFRGEKLYRKLVGNKQSLASIFVVNQVQRQLPENCRIFVDATFQIIPKGVYQLLIIHAEIEENVSSCIYI
jgi:hypothetical protein